MRVAVVVLAMLSLVASHSGEASAQAYARKRHTHVKAHVQHPASRTKKYETDGYIVRDANKLPFGSSIWWDQMLRENRAGTCCN
jgi:Tfp pilus assembly protein PilE